ncbi:hypothetical protein SEA_RIZWANA_87 [Arthrobacter phage Rizwana]|nr:hypothetical protein SEA_RIZWANA_87 [Arthrobacter phage Rizwana]
MPVHFITSPAKVYAVCGDRGQQSTDPARVTCFSCRNNETFKVAQRGMPMKLSDVLAEGVGQPTRRHEPPYLNDNDDNLWVFYDQRNPFDPNLRVSALADGHLQVSLGEQNFRLHHLDRMDLVRALLHDFHYSPETGGPDQ